MKLQLSIIIAASSARKINVNDIQRNLSGNYLEQLTGYMERGYNYGDANSVAGLATMAAFLQAPHVEQRNSIDSIEALDFSVADFVDKFTNYGCYCWILGVDKGVIGGGQTRDQIDGLCGQLYKCYKCLNIDYGNQETLFNYEVLLNKDDDGNRELECLDGPNVDACKCDKMFAERLADVTAQCNADLANGITDSPFCPNEEFRTENGGGTFNPWDTSADGCFKNGGDHHSKDGCCGEYPDRMPYDSMNRECCRMTSPGTSFFFDTLVPFAECEERGGELAPLE